MVWLNLTSRGSSINGTVHERKSKGEVLISECLVASCDDMCFQNFTKYECPIEARNGNSSVIKAHFQGKMLVNDSWKDSIMENVLYVSEAWRNYSL